MSFGHAEESGGYLLNAVLWGGAILMAVRGRETGADRLIMISAPALLVYRVWIKQKVGSVVIIIGAGQ